MAKYLLISGTFLRTFFMAWFGWSALHVSFIVWLNYPLAFAIGDSLLFNIPLAFLFLLQIYIMQYYLPKNNKVSYVAVSGILIALLVTFLSGLLERLLFREEDDFLNFIRTGFPVRVGVAFLLSACMSMITILIYSVEDQKKNEARRHEAEQLSKEAELFNLRSQLQPHFLFNSLNSISALAGSKPDEARKMIQQLSDFFRGTIRRDSKQLIPLKEELLHLQLYLDIEKVRFGHRLDAAIITDDTCNSMTIPPLLLQPIIENAIKFGLYDTLGTVSICIKAEAQPHMLTITIQNPYDAETSQPKKGTGFGLNSVQRRLHLLFSRTDLLSTASDKTTFTTTIKIPQHV